MTAAIAGRMPHKPRPAILLYHRIADDPFDPWGTVVSPQHFREQLEWLCRERRVLPLIELVELNRIGKLPSNAAAITLDDGYSCNAEVAAPLLKQLGLPATMFVPVEWIEHGNCNWWDEIRHLVLDNDAERLVLDEQVIELGERRATDHIWHRGKPPCTPRQFAFQELWERLLPRTPAEIDRSMNELRPQFVGDRVPSNSPRPMSPEQVRATASSLVEFGSHALNHPMLPALEGCDQAREIIESVARCEALSGSRPVAFAYPFGVFDESSERLAQEAGFRCACSTETGAISRLSPVFALPRVHVGDWSAPALKRTLAVL
jgi:peptidoglycan/xylan/chitin deacetylase (PgdA/CDA1 family)